MPTRTRRALDGVSRSRSLRVSDAARSNSPRASALRPSLGQQVGAHARQQVIARERRLVRERVDELAGRRPARYAIDTATARFELDDRRGRELRERVVQRDDPLPVGLARRVRARAWHAAIAACSA